MPRRDYERGRLVTPSPGLEAVYASLGGSTTHCEVKPFTGGSYVCESSGTLSDSNRHLDPHYRVITCPSCRPGAVVNGEVVPDRGQPASRPSGTTLGWIVADRFRIPIVDIRLQRGQTVLTGEYHGPYPAVDVPMFDILDMDGGLMWRIHRHLCWDMGLPGSVLTVTSTLAPPPART